MDFVFRHTSDHTHHAPPETSTSSPSSPGQPPPQPPFSLEEPEYLARYLVVKHSWRGQYKRILCISNHSLITLDPATLCLTNSYDVSNDFESASPVIGKDENNLEFNVNVRTGARGKFKGMKFSSGYRASILTELHRIWWSRLGTLAEFPVLHLRRKTTEQTIRDHVGYLGYVPKLLSAVAFEARRETMSSEESRIPDGSFEGKDKPTQVAQTPQERVRLSCLWVLHQLAASTTCAEAMAATSVGTTQVVPLLMKAIGWQGGSILALETLKRVVVAGNRARDALVAQGLRVGLIEVLLALLDWRAGGRNGFCSEMKWNESEASTGQVLAIEVLHALAAEGAHCTKVRDILDSSEVWAAYKDQKHDLFLPSNAQIASAGVAGLIESFSPPTRLTYSLTAPPTHPNSSKPPATITSDL